MDTDIMTEPGGESQQAGTESFIQVPLWILSMKVPEGAKLLAGHILSLSRQTGYAWKSNGRYAETFAVTAWTVRGWIKALEEVGLVRVEGRETGRRIFPLFTHNGPIPGGLEKSNPPLENPTPPVGKIQGEGLENPNGGGRKNPTLIDKGIDKEKREGKRDISLSAVGGETKKSTSQSATGQVEPSAKTPKKQEVQPFTEPTLEETVEYASYMWQVLNLSDDVISECCDQFLEHYEARGWVFPSGLPMKAWKPALDTWFRNAAKNGHIIGHSAPTTGNLGPTQGKPLVDPYAHLTGAITPIADPLEGKGYDLD